jgi:predicted  nucleic acid-binding Zn-ribbon protein
MNSDLEKLRELQQLDLNITALKTEVAAIPKRVQQIETKLSSAKKRVEDAKNAVKANELARRNHEHEIQGENNKIIKFREQSSSVKTNDQYRALLSEIDHAEKSIRGHEDKILDAMVELDVLNAEVKASEVALKAETAVNEGEKSQAQAEGKQKEQQLAERQKHRTELRAAIDEGVLTTYDRVAKGRGTGLAEARGQRCMGCQVMLRPQVWQDIVNSEGTQQCSSCSRIMYYDPANDVAAQAAAANIADMPVHQVEREWMFVPTFGPSGAFVVFVNHKGNASMKAYDAKTGTAIERKSEKNTIYQTAFAELLKDARNLYVDEPHVEERHKEQLPPEILEDLQHQVPNTTSNV